MPININLSPCPDVFIKNTDLSYTATTESGSIFQLPNIIITNSTGDTINTIPSVVNYVIPDVNWIDSDGTPYSTPYGETISASTCDSPLLSITVYSDSGFTTTITGATWNDSVYIYPTPSNFTPTSYTYILPDMVGGFNTFTSTTYYEWYVEGLGNYNLTVIASDGVNQAIGYYNFEVTDYIHPIVNDASNIARYSFENDSDLIFNGSSISQVNDLTGNGLHLIQPSAAGQPTIYSTLSPTGRQVADFDNKQMYNTFGGGSPIDYTDITFAFVMSNDGAGNTTRVGRITKTGQNDFNGVNSVAMQENRFEKINGNGAGSVFVKYDRTLCVVFYRLVSATQIWTDVFTVDGLQRSFTGLFPLVGTITYENVIMGLNNPNDTKIGEWHFIGRKLSDVEVQSYGEYLRKKWTGV